MRVRPNGTEGVEYGGGWEFVGLCSRGYHSPANMKKEFFRERLPFRPWPASEV